MDGIIRGFGEGGTESLDTTLGQDGQLTRDAAFGVVLDRADAGLMAVGATGVWHASVWPVPGGGPGVRRGARGLGPMAGYCRGTCCIP